MCEVRTTDDTLSGIQVGVSTPPKYSCRVSWICDGNKEIPLKSV